MQYQSMEPDFHKLQKHHQIMLRSFWKSGSFDWCYSCAYLSIM